MIFPSMVFIPERHPGWRIAPEGGGWNVYPQSDPETIRYCATIWEVMAFFDGFKNASDSLLKDYKLEEAP